MLLRRPGFDLPNYFARHVECTLVHRQGPPHFFLWCDLEGELDDLFFMDDGWSVLSIDLYASAVPTNRGSSSIAAIQRNAGTPRDFKCRIPEPVVVIVEVNGHPAHALLDTGSLADFMLSC